MGEMPVRDDHRAQFQPEFKCVNGVIFFEFGKGGLKTKTKTKRCP